MDKSFFRSYEDMVVADQLQQENAQYMPVDTSPEAKAERKAEYARQALPDNQAKAAQGIDYMTKNPGKPMPQELGGPDDDTRNELLRDPSKNTQSFNEGKAMSQTENFFRKYSDMVVEAEQISEGPALDRVSARSQQAASTPAQVTPTAADQKSGAYKSDAGVTKNDPNRVQVAPNVQKKVYDYEKSKQEVDTANKFMRQNDNPTATSVGTKIGGAIGDVVAGGRAAWDAGVDAFKGKTAPVPDPLKPVDIIPDPKRGSINPRESAGEIMRKLTDIAEGKTCATDNTKSKASELMKPYKAKKSEE